MKFTVHKLRIGDHVWAQVMEHVGEQELIVSFYGDLIRVRNESLRQLHLGDKVLVRVAAINPLAFQLVSEEERRKGATRLNVSV
jgi:hypothetical protein